MLNSLVKTPNASRHVDEESKVGRNFARSVVEVRKSKEMHERPTIVILDEDQDLHKVEKEEKQKPLSSKND